jgi:hypothetical protein
VGGPASPRIRRPVSRGRVYVSPRPTGRGGAFAKNKPSTPRPRPHDESWDEAERRVSPRGAALRGGLRAAVRCLALCRAGPAGAGPTRQSTREPKQALDVAQVGSRTFAITGSGARMLRPASLVAAFCVLRTDFFTALFYRWFLPMVLTELPALPALVLTAPPPRTLMV